ncbi:unnamed protein product [Gongylonema pulchrum]|uniref:NR LBD domain-containing protein n=1 Tax=Gongylonema pulchrum TaxID=637853 RepID=A0A183ES17_9BILA|nr:unnamed protein product [Gongylonema pulchrum]
MLCESMLSNMELNLTTDIVNLTVVQMYMHLWPLPEHANDALSEICDLTGAIIHRAAFPNASIFVTAKRSFTKNRSGNDRAFWNKLDDTVLYRCIMIVSAMIKTNRYKKMNTLLRGLLDGIVCLYFSHHSHCRLFKI